MALLNNIEADVKIKCIEAQINQQALGKAIGSTGQYVNRVMKSSNIINRTFVRMLEQLGYDIELTYKPRATTKPNLDALLDDND